MFVGHGISARFSACGRVSYCSKPSTLQWNLYNLFPPIEIMKSRSMDTHKLHFVFFEGIAGTGKKEILHRMKNLGYHVEDDTYLEHALYHLDKFSIQPQTQTVSLLWVAEKIQKLKQLSLQHQNGKKFQGNTVFIHRSPLSLEAHGTTFLDSIKIMEELKSFFTISIVYCWSDPTKIKERIGERIYWAQGNTKILMDKIYQEDLQVHIEENYKNMNKKGYFVADLPTTASKQATAQLLTMCDFGFDTKTEE